MSIFLYLISFTMAHAQVNIVGWTEFKVKGFDHAYYRLIGDELTVRATSHFNHMPDASMIVLEDLVPKLFRIDETKMVPSSFPVVLFHDFPKLFGLLGYDRTVELISPVKRTQ